MRILYVAPIRLPTERPHGYASMKMCEAFALRGHDVTLLVPRKRPHLQGDPFSYYGVRRNFKLQRLRSTDLLLRDFTGGSLRYRIDLCSFIVSLLVGAQKLLRGADVLYTRDPYVALVLPSKRTVLELHTLPPDSGIARRVIRRARVLAVISKGLAEDIRARFGREADVILPDAVDSERFAFRLEPQEARARLELPLQVPMVVYTGNFYPWKGVDVLVRAMETLPEVTAVLVGGTDEVDVARVRSGTRGCSHVLVRGFERAERMPLYLAAADVLVIPNAPGSAISERHTSPLKLFEYMASGKPIVASDLPSIREVLSKEMATFAEAGNAQALAAGIKEALGGGPEVAQKATRALKAVTVHTWEARAVRVLSVWERIV